MADDIAQWLERLGLGQYAQAFAENGIALDVLPRLSEEDLKELGINLGDRRRLQAALETSGSLVEQPAAGVGEEIAGKCCQLMCLRADALRNTGATGPMVDERVQRMRR